MARKDFKKLADAILFEIKEKLLNMNLYMTFKKNLINNKLIT